MTGWPSNDGGRPGGGVECACGVRVKGFLLSRPDTHVDTHVVKIRGIKWWAPESGVPLAVQVAVPVHVFERAGVTERVPGGSRQYFALTWFYVGRCPNYRGQSAWRSSIDERLAVLDFQGEGLMCGKKFIFVPMLLEIQKRNEKGSFFLNFVGVFLGGQG